MIAHVGVCSLYRPCDLPTLSGYGPTQYIVWIRRTLIFRQEVDPQGFEPRASPSQGERPTIGPGALSVIEDVLDFVFLCPVYRCISLLGLCYTETHFSIGDLANIYPIHFV